MTSEKNTSPATLATVKHGGCVQLEASVRERFEAWASVYGFPVAKTDGLYHSYTIATAWLAWQQAALAAREPDTDEQYADEQALIDHLDELMDDGGQGGEKWPPAQAAIAGIIAARQPVGEPAAWITQDALEAFAKHRAGNADAATNSFAYAMTGNGFVPLYRYPPAQAVGLGEIIEQIAQQWDGCNYDTVGETIDIGPAIRAAGKRLVDSNAAQAVDLGQFRPAVELMEWQERGHAHPDFPTGDPKKHAEALRLLALIDSQAVGNG